MPPPEKRDPSISARTKEAIRYLIEERADIAAAAAHTQVATFELRRQLAKPHVRRYSLEQRQIALEAFCLGSPAALTKVRNDSSNGMAVVAAVKAGEMLKVGAIEAEAASQRRMPGLSIVLIQKDGGHLVAYEPPQRPPMLDIAPAPTPEPAIAPDAEAE
jgi:hypothetical protein